MKIGPLVTAMVTPFTDDGEVNYGEAGRLASYLVENGCDDILVCGTTGEVPALEDEEKINLIETVSQEIGERGRVLAGTGSYNTSHSIEMSRKAEEAGADAIMLVVPYYNKPPQDSLYRHFAAVADSSDLPIMLYNVPSRTSRNLKADTAVELSRIDNITAIKEASGDLEQVAEIAARTSPEFQVLSGDDGLTLPIMSVGGSGVVSVAAHIAPAEIKKLLNLCQENDFHRAHSINSELLPLFKAIFMTTNPIPVKTALSMLGWDVGGFRLPLSAMEKEEKDKLNKFLIDNNYLQ